MSKSLPLNQKSGGNDLFLVKGLVSALFIFNAFLFSFSTKTFAQAQANDVQLNDLYEVLLTNKDDTISMISNIVYWILAIASILAAILIALYGWQWNVFRKNNMKVKEMIKVLDTNIEKAEDNLATVTEIQKKIDDYLESTEFHKKIDTLESKVNQISRVTNKIAEEELEQVTANKRNLLDAIEFIYWHDGHRIESRIENPEDMKNFDEIKKFYNLKSEIKQAYSLEDIRIYKDRIYELYGKYRRPEDPPA